MIDSGSAYDSDFHSCWIRDDPNGELEFRWLGGNYRRCRTLTYDFETNTTTDADWCTIDGSWRNPKIPITNDQLDIVIVLEPLTRTQRYFPLNKARNKTGPEYPYPYNISGTMPNLSLSSSTYNGGAFRPAGVHFDYNSTTIYYIHGDSYYEGFVQFNVTENPTQLPTYNPVTRSPSINPTMMPSELLTKNPSLSLAGANVDTISISDSAIRTTIISTTNREHSNSSSEHSTWKIFAIIGWVLACLITLLSAGICIYCILKRKRMENEIKMKHIQDRAKTNTLDLQPAVSVPSVSIHPESVGTNHHRDESNETDSNDNTLSMTNENSPGSVAEGNQGMEITGTEEVRVWLKEKVGLPQYLTNLVQNGYDSINMIKEIENVSDLVEIGIEDCDHSDRIMEAILEIKTTPIGTNEKSHTDEGI